MIKDLRESVLAVIHSIAWMVFYRKWRLLAIAKDITLKSSLKGSTFESYNGSIDS